MSTSWKSFFLNHLSAENCHTKQDIWNLFDYFIFSIYISNCSILFWDVHWHWFQTNVIWGRLLIINIFKTLDALFIISFAYNYFILKEYFIKLPVWKIYYCINFLPCYIFDSWHLWENFIFIMNRFYVLRVLSLQESWFISTYYLHSFPLYSFFSEYLILVCNISYYYWNNFFYNIGKTHGMWTFHNQNRICDTSYSGGWNRKVTSSSPVLVKLLLYTGWCFCTL